MSRVASSVTRTVLAIVLLSGVLSAGVAFAGNDAGSVNFTLGYKSLDGDWYLGPPTVPAPSRVSQPALGVEFTWGRKGWPARIALDVLHSYDDGITHVPRFFTVPAYDQRLRASTLEIGLGFRRGVTLGSFTPYVGAGGSWVRGNVLAVIIDPAAGAFGTGTANGHARASAVGVWAGGGLTCRIGPRFQLGLAGRYSKATLPATAIVVDQGTLPTGIAGTPELDGGGRHFNLVLGWSFPGRE